MSDRSVSKETAQPSLEVERREHLLDALGALVSHLHVPRSLGSMMVPPEYDIVRDLIGDFGWSTSEEVTARLRHVLLADRRVKDNPDIPQWEERRR